MGGTPIPLLIARDLADLPDYMYVPHKLPPPLAPETLPKAAINQGN